VLFEIALPGGIYGNGTSRQAAGRWRDANLVRSPEGPNLQPVGGWAQRGTAAVTGAARAVLPWKENNGTRWIGVGTHSRLQVQSASGALADITPTGFTAGAADAATGGGYGAGSYGAGAWGTPRPDTGSITPATVWTLDTWGERLVGCGGPQDGKLYEWGLNTSVKAAAIAGAPTDCDGLVTTGERFLMALRRRTVQWCDQGDNTAWTPLPTNQAGDQDLDTSGTLKCGRRVSGATLLFTDVDVWRARYLGPPYVFGFEKAGADCGLIATGAVVSLDTRCVWMGKQGFFLYNGYTEALPCEAADKVFSDFNLQQASKVTAFHNAQFGEVWWFYPSGGSNENDRYVFWNYRLDHWWTGALARTCGAGPGVFQYPILIDTAGRLQEHESGLSWGATPFARSGPIEWPGDLASGERRLLVRGLIADERTQGDVQASFHVREAPNGTEATLGPFVIGAAPTSCLFSARQAELTVSFARPAEARFGGVRLDVATAGRR
jgi:hypothetical protein